MLGLASLLLKVRDSILKMWVYNELAFSINILSQKTILFQVSLKKNSIPHLSNKIEIQNLV